MLRHRTDFLVAATVIAVCHPALAQLLNPLEHFAESHILWDFVPPKQFFSLCMKVGNEVGSKSADVRVCQSSCEKHVAQYKDAEAKLHCQFMALQMEIATLQEVYHGPYEFCKSMLMYQSYNLKIDVLDYVKKSDLWDVCTQSIVNAMEAGVGLGQTEAIQQNLPLGCKEAVESLYKERGMPIPSASIACKPFVQKAQTALSAQELSPADQGKQFCDGNSMQAVAFKSSAPSEAPLNFPLSIAIPSDWKPKVTLEEFKQMVRKAYRNPTDAFTTYDANGDGNLDSKEWLKMGRDLGIPTMDIQILSDLIDEDQNSKISKDEWRKIMGITLPELVYDSNAKYHNADKGWKAADKDGDGDLTPKEFEAVCAGLGVTPENAKRLFPEIDKDGSNGISQEEYKNVFGVGIPELKRRAREKFGAPKKSFKAMDVNGDGKITPEEFEKACKDLNIPKERAKKLLGDLDADSSGDIEPKEWVKAMGMTSEDAKDAIAKKFGANPLAMDTNGDGQLSPEEVTAGIEKAGASPEEAAKLLKDMDKDGDGKVSPEEIHEGIGGADLDKARGFSHPSGAGAGTGAGSTSPTGITLPEFKERAKKKHGTPQAAFDAFDASPKDGKISPEEFLAGAQLLVPPVSAEDAPELFKALDKNGDLGVEPREWFEATGGCADCKESFGVTLPEFKARAKKKHGSPQAAYDAMDANPKDGKVTPEEFEAGCAKLEPPISAEEAKPLFAKLDVKPTDSTITPEEFFGGIGGPSKFGLTLPEFKDRAEKKSGPPKKAYEAMDQNGDGKVAPEEFQDYCQSLAPPVTPEESTPLFNELDKNGDGKVAPEEFFEEVGKEAFSGAAGAGVTGVSGPASEGVAPEKGQIGDADGDGKISPAEKLAKTRALDLDGDGKVSQDEMGAAAAGGKLSPQEMKALDTDGDGKLSQDELKQGAAATSASAEDQKKVMDADGDGKVTPDEIATAAARGQLSPAEVRKMDADGDGKLSPAELKHGAKAVETAAAAATKERMMKILTGEGGSKSKAHKEAAKTMDKDGDGKVSPAEMKKGLEAQGWGTAEAEKMVKEMGKDGLWSTWGDGYGDIDPFGSVHKTYGDIDPFGSAHKQTNNLPPEEVTMNMQSQRLPAMKWQEAKALEGSQVRGEAMKKLLHDTAVSDLRKEVEAKEEMSKAKEAPHKFMSRKKGEIHNGHRPSHNGHRRALDAVVSDLRNEISEAKESDSPHKSSDKHLHTPKTAVATEPKKARAKVHEESVSDMMKEISDAKKFIKAKEAQIKTVSEKKGERGSPHKSSDNLPQTPKAAVKTEPEAPPKVNDTSMSNSMKEILEAREALIKSMSPKKDESGSSQKHANNSAHTPKAANETEPESPSKGLNAVVSNLKKEISEAKNVLNKSMSREKDGNGSSHRPSENLPQTQKAAAATEPDGPRKVHDDVDERNQTKTSL